ncbi:bifunctional 2',3'-cyclic-nucleotide 2'-phosphodiesterase/3'-nucleotidase [Roseicyclus marinus]|uniref:bifunctional 2',3'-cyclic-nucleotide 2'-phosphodiesterase/3'-nucleotidase n=1 Tax=Roseicyclus marinus TaxID=2161673 RepID=UPI002410AE7B|nr:bifunctional 2',3'-cyclic-nucleotide 2'-phosphodiesterase/3'-nucleotidase [Roseicyclus marinus]MDG3042675.1 bifunctional 2',3'-cyclic-nucleotide 2'-phosphodiesterase/3'-nucleotidase [Roseicyclus marinus]
MTIAGTRSGTHAAGAGLAAAGVRLRILATSDLHAHLLPFNYFSDRPEQDVGLSNLAALIQRARAGCPNTLLFDNGDTLQGAPLADAALSDLMPRGDTHPMITLMNALGYDAATLGNHDFDFGLGALQQALAGARYPVVLGNVDWMATDPGPVRPGLILDRVVVDEDGAPHRLRVGVTGAVPPQVMRWARAHLQGRIDVGHILPAMSQQAAALREAGADIVVVLAHSGLGHDTDASEGENVGRLLARIDGVDAVIAGHTHRTFPSAEEPPTPLGGTPMVQPGCWGSHLGQIDLDLAAPPIGSGRPWRVRGSEAVVTAATDIRDEDRERLWDSLQRMPGLQRDILRSHRATRRYSARALGRTAVPFETYFSLIAPCAATQVIADAQRAAAVPLIRDRPDLAGLPLISAATPFKSGGRGGPLEYTDVPAGPLLLRHAADLYGYSNGLILLRASGALLRDWLERSASAFNRVVPGAGCAPQPLLDRAFASYNFDRLDGLRYDIDLSQPARTDAEGTLCHPGPGRIRNLRLSDGRPVEDTASFLVVTSTYRAAGGGHFPAAQACETIHESTDPVRDALVAHIMASPCDLDPVIEPSFRFTPLGGATVVVHTGPSAAAHPDRVHALGMTADGTDEDGFARYLMRI